MKLRLPWWGVWTALLFGLSAAAHQGHHHEHNPAPTTEPGHANQALELNALKSIGENYAREIQPIFSAKCMDCHGGGRRHYPWYHALPGVQQFIDRDVTEAREHLEFTNGFPFRSHASPTEDLAAIRTSVNDGTMPPFAYRLLHLDNRLTPDEKTRILRWIEQSELTLKK